MTESVVPPAPQPPTDSAPPPPTEPPGPTPPPYAGMLPPSLYRDPDDRVIGGVCAAAGRYTNTDPVLWRVAIAVLAVFGGTGIALYILGWLLIPSRTSGQSLLESSLRRRGRPWSAGAVLIVALFALIIIGGFDAEVVVALGVLGLVGFLVYRDQQGSPVPAFGGPPSEPSPWQQATAAPSGDMDAGGATVPPPSEPPAWAAWAPPPPARPPQPRSSLGLATISLAALLAGGLAWANVSGAQEVTPARIAAAALLVVGGGLVVGTFLGRARWLIAVGAVLGVVLAGTAGAQTVGVGLDDGIGERRWVVVDGDREPRFALSAGEAVLDLTNLPVNGQRVVVRSSVSLGELRILLPDDLPVRLRAQIKLGEFTEFGSVLDSAGDRVDLTRSYGPAGDPRIEIEANVGLGEIEVRRG